MDGRADRARRVRAATPWLLLAAGVPLGALLVRRSGAGPAAWTLVVGLRNLALLYGRSVRADGAAVATRLYGSLLWSIFRQRAYDAYRRRFRPPTAGSWEATWLESPGWLGFRDQAAARISAAEARFVRQLRDEEEYSWSGIAGATAEAWHTSWESNQGAGMFLCEAAAQRLGEDPNATPWN